MAALTPPRRRDRSMPHALGFDGERMPAEPSDAPRHDCHVEMPDVVSELLLKAAM